MPKYKVIQSDPGSALFVGAVITPYYEDSKELIYAGSKFDFHIKKDGEYFKTHLQEVK